ncbi:hypothetical protein JCM8202_004211 [Rhodotorula sphaerocarpa]
MAVKGDPDAAADVKPEQGNDGKLILTIRLGNNQEELTIKVKPTTKFAKVYSAVAANTGKDANAFRLHWDGERIDSHQTPAELGFEQEEILDLHLEQVGGA